MPIISVKMTKEDGGATREQKEELAKKLTKAFVEVFKRSEKTAVVTIDEVSMDNYSIGGETVREIRKKSFK